MKLCVIISCTEKDTKETIVQTFEGIANQKNSPFSWDIVFWCAQGCRPQNLMKYIQQLCQTEKYAAKPVVSRVFESNVSFLGGLTSSLSKILRDCSGSCSHVLLCSCGVVPKESCFLVLEEKMRSIAKTVGATVLTAFGVRMFPHEELDDVRQLREGVHWKFYTDQHTDRALHFLTPDFCVIDVNALHQISAHSSAPFLQFDDIWCSFVLGHTLGLQVWKIEAKALIDCTTVNPPHFFQCLERNKHRESLYLHMYQNDWPRSIFHSAEKVKITQAEQNKQPAEVWKQGFGGMNMAITPASELDFAAAASCGIKVIRVGAVADAKDMAFVIDPKASSTEEDKAHLLQALPRLRNALSKASESGLKVIITMADLPGGRFHSCSEGSGSYSFWESSVCRSRAIKFWGYMAKSLADMSPSVVMGYDIINEPYTPQDQENGFFDDASLAHADELNQFYMDVLREIRSHDKTVAVIIKSTWFASPRSFEILRPLPDPHVVYAFHVYTPPCITLYRLLGPTYMYPGSVPRWPCCPDDTIEITRDYLQHLLETTVHSWQTKHKIPSSHILVAEFGICREVVGAQQYIQDLISIFQHFGWSWLVFSFRDEEWDAMDYELGTDMNNTLDRSTENTLFKTISNHFH